MDVFLNQNKSYLALDNFNNLTYLAPNKANLNIMISRHIDINFNKTREQ